MRWTGYGVLFPVCPLPAVDSSRDAAKAISCVKLDVLFSFLGGCGASVWLVKLIGSKSR